MRLESSLRHEPILTVRSKIADLDAAVNWYVKNRPERSETPPVQAIRRAIQHLEYALETPQEEQVTAPDWSKYGIESLAPQFVNRKCSLDTGLLYVNGGDIPIAHLKRALDLLAVARGTPTGQSPQPYDFTKEAEDCLARQKEGARRAAEAAEQKRREAAAGLAAWRAAHQLRIEFKARKDCSIDVTTEDGGHSGYVRAGMTIVADAKETASVLVWDPDCWDISVNGSPAKLNFTKTQPGSAYQYESVVRLKDFAR
ncbi:MAG: hypothetical protein HYS38_06065 [Acidobacteria bacterium]|nr:hypothetical protein [Acidobacteriota bacterium]